MVSMTFAMIKPEAVAFPHVAMAIFRQIFSGGLEVVGAKRIQLSANDAKQLYGIHRDKFFYERLIRHVTSGPVIVMQLRSKNDDAIECWRRLMGPSKLLKSLKESERTSLRAQFAISDTRNLVHGADSTQRAVIPMTAGAKEVARCRMPIEVLAVERNFVISLHIVSHRSAEAGDRCGRLRSSRGLHGDEG
uniref:Nucleoside diphosphate kinase-like domain-containing protein n=1 Tax=Ascaris lumbricoides TaxID=6252 RepID=A0A9J2P1P8_ASCLU